eukprot:SAG22_NODE_5234_length_1056_cov_1.141066_2_plen_21_part_01
MTLKSSEETFQTVKAWLGGTA